MRGTDGLKAAQMELGKALADESPYVRIVAAEALGRYGTDAELKQALPVLVNLAAIDKHGLHVSVAALNALDHLGARAAGAKAAIQALPVTDAAVSPRQKEYNRQLVKHILTNFP